MSEVPAPASRESRRFHLGDLLSVTTGILVSPRYMDGLSDIVSYLTGADLDVDRIQQTLQVCRAYVIAEVPALDDADVAELDKDNWRGWLDTQTGRFGEWHMLQRPAEGLVSLPR